jgi:hypothetical protein
VDRHTHTNAIHNKENKGSENIEKHFNLRETIQSNTFCVPKYAIDKVLQKHCPLELMGCFTKGTCKGSGTSTVSCDSILCSAAAGPSGSLICRRCTTYQKFLAVLGIANGKFFIS